MTEGRTRTTGCFKLGCFGCAGVTLLALLIFGTLIGVGALVGAPEPRVERSSVEQPVPPAEPFAGRGTDEAGPSLPPGGLVPEVDEPGRVVLDLSMGEFEVVAGETPGPVRIESEFDTAVFELVTEFERYGESGWIYRIRVKRKIGWYRLLFGMEDQRNFVRIVLPPEVPLSLEGEVRMGETRMDLGGLWLVSIDLEAAMGEFAVDFGEPLPAPMNGFRLVSKMGESRVRNLGNASPNAVFVHHSMGSLSLDLYGAWRNDAEVEAGVGMGELVVRVPEDVNLDLANMSQTLGDAILADRSMLERRDAGAPTITLDVSGGMGSIEVRR